LKNNPYHWLVPDWPAPERVKAISTTRQGGFSQYPFNNMNLGDHVNDNSAIVRKNRRHLKKSLNLQNEPLWLTQIHSNKVSNADAENPEITADASVSSQPGNVCAVMTADCLPVLFCNKNATTVAAAHAGWRGLEQGILEKTVAVMDEEDAEQIMAWLGPAIGPKAFEVGGEVRAAFVDRQPEAEAAFVKQNTDEDKWLADIYLLARLRLTAIGIKAIYGGGYCTYKDSEKFFSFRRDGETGRMASLIWID
jgi:YfiH family protein